ncbi:MAG: hypothetical protein OEZ59_08805 [Deltaproteobacteria bacterium]|nr:hypothetical protein [Deltaproteobacteria bacterium]
MEKDEGVLRLTWRVVGAKLRYCREYTDSEKNRLTKHMQRGQYCISKLLPYQLKLDIDGKSVIDEEMQPPGARGDRPLYVVRDVRLKPGSYQFDLSFKPLDPFKDAKTPEEIQEREEMREATATSLSKAPSFSTSQTVEIVDNKVIVVDLREDKQEFVVLTSYQRHEAQK